jgi:hypothetical protein
MALSLKEFERAIHSFEYERLWNSLHFIQAYIQPHHVIYLIRHPLWPQFMNENGSYAKVMYIIGIMCRHLSVSHTSGCFVKNI